MPQFVFFKRQIFWYILLAKQDGKWMIEQVLWEVPLVK